MNLKKGDLLDLRVDGVAFGGKGIAKIDGLTVFIDNGIPQDYVSARIIKKKKKYLEARVEAILEPSTYRVEPECEYSGFCGGCKWQTLRYEKQVEYKRQHVVDSLEHIGLFHDIEVHATIPSGKIFGYRNKMEFSCSDRRWLLPEELGKDDVEIGFALGLHVPGTFYKVLDNKYCLLQPDFGNKILNDVQSFIRNSNVPVYGLRSHEGYWRFLMLRHSVAFDQWMVNIITADEDRETVQPIADILTERYPEVVSVVNNINSGKAGIAVGEYEINLAGSSSITERIGSYHFTISSNSFFQTNTSGAFEIYKKVKEYAGLTGREIVLDLYSGTGSIAIFLSDSAKKVTGLEMVESAVGDAEKNCINNSVSNCTFIPGDIRYSLAQIKTRPDVLIIDPPRSGMHKDVVKQIMAAAPERIVYVSCNPATMARDLAMIKDSYEIVEVQPIDMFPHTYHIESVAKIRRK
ncbi:23S rRNA (uracil1939-C5)-methyltransferase [Desulfosarcina sp. BuS5]|uniref:23S rRNA (uracil(1939)-C(5))-methyltransferase RlmD n=1 Tax=Desulfosarcina sp. BuS5 TaxID=933262 RepID=UPI000482593D|nr:23S rRNA (uracil(1939)-C(5))-methyltransferase RlmD [Desulfosarcina sp. BuS5]WDN88183.1 23S rRNA (uracil1939-C5)-methyltransferase [Desulfosarcina sp. BuS5]